MYEYNHAERRTGLSKKEIIEPILPFGTLTFFWIYKKIIYNNNKLRELEIARIEKSSIELNRVRKTGSEMAGLAGGRFLTSLFGFYFEAHIEEASRTRNIRLKTRQEEGQ